MATESFNPVGLALRARHDWVGAFDDLASKGALVKSQFRLPVAVIQDPTLAREVLVSDAACYGRPWVVRSVIGDALGETLFLLDGPAWLARRRPVAPVFGLGRIEELTQIVTQTIEDEISRWSPGKTADIQQNLTRLTMRVACTALLGTDPHASEVGRRIEKHLETLVGWIGHRFTHPAAPPAVVPTARNRAMRAARAALEETLTELLGRRRSTDDLGFDVLGQLVQAQRDLGELTDADIVDECIGFLFAGHETTASTLSWALYELATHSGDQTQVAAEGDRLNTASTHPFTDSQGLDHTAAVAREVLRLYPAGIGIARVTKRRTFLGGDSLHRGTIVLIAVYSIQRSAAGWANPDDFDPSRTSHRADDQLAHYLPFGAGPRRCLGARFAETEMRLALATICSRWSLSYGEPAPPTPVALPSLRPKGGLPLNLTPRTPPPTVSA
jgi:cytochrome P450